MPRVELETLFRGGSCSGDSRIVCETLIPADQQPEKPHLPSLDPDLPAESFRLPIRDEIDWVDRNAFFERKRSTKGYSNWANWSNPESRSQPIPSNLKSNSKRSIIIGLPKRPETRHVCPTSRRSCRPASFREMMKSSGPVPVTEPVSPKVSCIGRVRPKDKAKGRRWRQGSSKNSAPAGKSGKDKVGFWAKLLPVFRLRRRRPRFSSEENTANGSSPEGKDVSADVINKNPAVVDVAATSPPGLGGLQKFTSGRRPASWGGDVEVDLKESAAREKDSSARAKGVFWRRRAVAPPQVVEPARDLEDVGPVTV